MADRPAAAPLDRYVVLEYLAEGGMGAIYLGKKLGAGGFEREVVLKQLLPEFTQQPEFIDLFLREARLSATLDHANIIHTIDLVTAGAEHFIVMEYLPGADLRSLLKRVKRRRRKFSPAACAYVARELLSALSYAHNKRGADGTHLRLIHRDISPSNILISRNGEVKLTDFGIAKASTHNSVFYRVKGKVGYMSPEQAKSQTLDSRSDLYSLAVCIYEMIGGERLFVSAGLTTSADELYSQPIPPLYGKVKGVPPELDEVVQKALCLDPRGRYQTAGEFQEALVGVAHRTGLNFSGPDLSAHLRELCGDPGNWRDIEAQSDAARIGEGTEIYAPEGTEQIAVAELEESAAEVIEVFHEMGEERTESFFHASEFRKRLPTSVTKLSRFQGLELTSMINIAGIAGNAGSEPLVDLDAYAAHEEEPEQTGALVELASLAGDGESQRLPAAPAFRIPLALPPEPEPEPEPQPDPTPLPVASSPQRSPGASRGASLEELDYVPGFGPAHDDAKELLATRRSRRTMWVVLAVIILLGLGIAATIGLSGPKIEQIPTGATPAHSPKPASPSR